MNFVDMLPKIRKIAYSICRKYGDKFVVDELVNEAWIGSIMNNHTDAKLIVRAAKLDIIDYIRTYTGRYSGIEEYDKRCNYMRIKRHPKFFTNCQNNRTDLWGGDDSFRRNSILDGDVLENGYNEVDNKEFINMLLSEISIKRSTAMIHYYLQEKNLVETGILMGGQKDCSVSGLLKRGRQECASIAEDLGLEPCDIIGG